jgi:hypothetical protein
MFEQDIVRLTDLLELFSGVCVARIFIGMCFKSKLAGLICDKNKENA